jgi:hypothetical protein
VVCSLLLLHHHHSLKLESLDDNVIEKLRINEYQYANRQKIFYIIKNNYREEINIIILKNMNNLQIWKPNKFSLQTNVVVNRDKKGHKIFYKLILIKTITADKKWKRARFFAELQITKNLIWLNENTIKWIIAKKISNIRSIKFYKIKIIKIMNTSSKNKLKLTFKL